LFLWFDLKKKRFFSDFLASWLVSERRKPLIVRGARQVGKTWLVRELARSSERAGAFEGEF
jgi:predicted AAA+ superfamily ATPase